MRVPSPLVFASVLSLLCLAYAACDEPAPPQATAHSSGSGSFPLEVRSADGVAMTLAAPPRRVLPTNTGVEDFVRALLGPDRVCALPKTLGDYGNIERTGWQDHPRIEGYQAEPLLALDPDLVIVHPWQAAGTTAALRRAGVPVLVVPDATSFDSMLETLELLGRIFDTPEQAAATVADLRARVARLDASKERRRGVRAMGYANFGMGGTASGRQTTMDLMLALTGMRNAAADAGLVGYEPMDFEQLLTIDPDVIVLGSQGDGYQGSPTAEVLRSEAALQGLSAVRADRILVLPSKLFATNSQFLIDAAEELARRVDELYARTEGERHP